MPVFVFLRLLVSGARSLRMICCSKGRRMRMTAHVHQPSPTFSEPFSPCLPSAFHDSGHMKLQFYLSTNIKHVCHTSLIHDYSAQTKPLPLKEDTPDSHSKNTTTGLDRATASTLHSNSHNPLSDEIGCFRMSSKHLETFDSLRVKPHNGFVALLPNLPGFFLRSRTVIWRTYNRIWYESLGIDKYWEYGQATTLRY